jgi:hypothetical protein
MTRSGRFSAMPEENRERILNNKHSILFEYDDKTPFDVADNDEIRKILRDAGGKSGKDIE